MQPSGELSSCGSVNAYELIIGRLQLSRNDGFKVQGSGFRVIRVQGKIFIVQFEWYH